MKRATKISLLVGIVLIATTILVPAVIHLNVQRSHWMKTDGCPRQLRRVGQAMLLYSNDHEGKLPNNLDELVAKNYLPDAKTLECPVDHSRYTLIAGGRKNALLDPNEIIAFERIGAHGDFGCMTLFGDGHVAWLSKAEFERQLLATTLPADQK